MSLASSGSHTVGDVDCDESVGPVDGLKILRYDAGLGYEQQGSCPDIGTEINGNPEPSPTDAPSDTFTFPAFYGETHIFEGAPEQIIKRDVLPAGQFGDDVVAPTGADFAVLLMRVTNTGTSPDYISSYSFRLRDSMGRYFTMSFTDSSQAQSNAQDEFERSGQYATIQPGIPTDMVFVFLVPENASGLEPEACPDDGC